MLQIKSIFADINPFSKPNLLQMKHLLLLCIVIFIFSTYLSAQNNIDLASLPDVPTYVVTQSNPSADTVIIGLHGGPSDELYPGDFAFFENISTFSVVEMKQYQHLFPEILENLALTVEEAIIMNDTTVALLQKAILYYKALDKKVVIVGHSFGAFLISEYIDDYGTEDVLKAIPMSGRLNMNTEIVDAFANGFFGDFVDGIMTQIEAEKAELEYWAAMKLQAGIGYNRYVDSLQNLDLTKLMYVYGTADEAVGRLLPIETEMLNNTNATVLTIQEGDHGAPFDLNNMEQVLTFIRKSITGTTDTPNQAVVSFFPTVIQDGFTVNANKNGMLSIVNIMGQRVHQENCSKSQQKINISTLPSGIYIVNYLTIDNEWKSQKIIKQ